MNTICIQVKTYIYHRDQKVNLSLNTQIGSSWFLQNFRSFPWELDPDWLRHCTHLRCHGNTGFKYKSVKRDKSIELFYAILRSEHCLAPNDNKADSIHALCSFRLQPPCKSVLRPSENLSNLSKLKYREIFPFFPFGNRWQVFCYQKIRQ